MKSKLKSVLLSLGILVGVFVTASLAAPQAEEPAFRFARIFTDHMVLQQNKPVTVWGWARAGEQVTVTLTQDQSIGEKAVEPLSPGDLPVEVKYVEKEPAKLATQKKSTQADAYGRWSVQFPPAKAGFTPTWVIAVSGGETIAIQDVLIGEVWVCAGQSNMGWSNFNRKLREAPSADFPGLRYIAWHDSWYKPLDDIRIRTSWSACSPQTAEKYAAVPYLYGMYLHRYLKVPVGIINVARGGTLGQTWCLRSELNKVDNEMMNTVLADYDAETAQWDDPAQVKRIMAEHEQLIAEKKAEHAEKAAQAQAAGQKEPRLRLPKPPTDPRRGWSPPAGLFNATVMPIRHLGVGGVLYYQGENQAFGLWTRYEYTFPRVPVSFRKAFGDADLPFGCISQPGWGTFGLDPEVSAARGGYHVVRDIQRRALKGDAHSGMIATYPAGNSYIHPGEKLPVAEWASLWALAKVYKKPVVHRANQYTGMKVKDDKLYLYFDSDPIVYERWKHIERNAFWQVLPCPYQGNAEFKGFTLAGKDRRWYPAKARHVYFEDEPCIELTCDLVPEPVAARYGWEQWPTGNLVGRDNLPLPTFRTDDWPLPVSYRYSDAARKRSEEELKRMMEEAEAQARDRKFRQTQIDLQRAEHELYIHKGYSDPKGLVQSKINRMQSILDEMEKDEWLSRQLRNYPELQAKLKAVREATEQAKGAANNMK